MSEKRLSYEVRVQQEKESIASKAFGYRYTSLTPGFREIVDNMAEYCIEQQAEAIKEAFHYSKEYVTLSDTANNYLKQNGYTNQ